MGRLGKLIIASLVGIAAVAIACIAVIFIVSGGSPRDFAQGAFRQISLELREDELALPAGTDATPLRFQVEVGDSATSIAQRLFDANLIADLDLFMDYVVVNDLDTQLEVGVYFLNQTQTIPQIAVALTDSSSSVIPFRILEGWRLEEVAAAVDSNTLLGFTGAEFMAVVGPGAQPDPTFAAQVGLPPGASLEGFLFPDTYQLPASVTASGLRDILTQTFLEKIGPQATQDAATQGFTLYDIATLGSIVEREAPNTDEHPLVASVYRNRLASGIKLDADPTVQYGFAPQADGWWPQITQDHYSSVASPYNTYLNPGLPPGPIANAGLSALLAAVYPTESDFLYFRAACDGSGYHQFAFTFDEHVANACQ